MFFVFKHAIRSINLNSARNIARIPHYERHIRFDPQMGRKRPCYDVLDRFKRLNNGTYLSLNLNIFFKLGLWIRTQAARSVKRYAKDDIYNETIDEYVTCTKEECMMLDKIMTPFWLRPKHYVDDPYEPYHARHGLNQPRMNFNKEFAQERKKILLDDTTSNMYFYDR